jgi:hypothetical protein
MDSNHQLVRPYLTFALLDSLISRPLSELDQEVERTQIRRIGPLIEFAYLDYARAEARLSSGDEFPTVRALKSALDKFGVTDFQTVTTLSPNNFEFMRSFQSEEETNDSRWITFCKRLEKAAASASLGDSFAKALTGTVEEMTSNIVEHSERAETGIVGYRRSLTEFEYVVADSGIGVLASLQKNPHYLDLTDSGKALETAIQEGESRHGLNVGHGGGFRHLLNNIANKNSYLRFRSGDYHLVIDGTQTPVISKTMRCRALDGFVICVVSKKITE